jgi:hypothetical protein
MPKSWSSGVVNAACQLAKMPRRGIREEKEYSDAIGALRINYRRLDAAIGNISDVLCVHPEMFPSLPGYRLHRVRISKFPGIPELSIYFTYDDNLVYLMDAVLQSEEETE